MVLSTLFTIFRTGALMILLNDYVEKKLSGKIRKFID